MTSKSAVEGPLPLHGVAWHRSGTELRNAQIQREETLRLAERPRPLIPFTLNQYSLQIR